VGVADDIVEATPQFLTILPPRSTGGGVITPFGGLAFLVGWLFLALSATR